MGVSNVYVTLLPDASFTVVLARLVIYPASGVCVTTTVSPSLASFAGLVVIVPCVDEVMVMEYFRTTMFSDISISSALAEFRSLYEKSKGVELEFWEPNAVVLTLVPDVVFADNMT